MTAAENFGLLQVHLGEQANEIAVTSQPSHIQFKVSILRLCLETVTKQIKA